MSDRLPSIRNVADTLRATARGRPGSTAMRAAAGAVSYADLDARVDAAAWALRRRGLRPGQRLAVCEADPVGFVVAVYGGWRAGAAVVPLDPALEAGRLDGLLDIVAPACVVGTAFAAGTGHWIDPDALANGGDAPHLPGLDGLALIAVDGDGADGVRVVPLSHANLLANQWQLTETRLAPLGTDIVLAGVPLWSVYGLNAVLGVGLSSGAEVVPTDGPATIVEAVLEGGATVLVVATPALVAVAELLDRRADGPRPLRYVAVAGPRIPDGVVERVTAATGAPVWESYAIAEASPVVTTTAMLDAPRVGAVGAPLPEVQVRLTDAAGAAAAAGEPGVIRLRGPNVFAGYWRDHATTADRFDEQGWFDTRDTGIVVDGALTIVDRPARRRHVHSRRRVTVYTRQGCHLCEEAIAVVRREAAGLAEIELVDIDGDPELLDRYTVRVPVVAVDGVEIADYQIAPEQLRSALT